ncbi:MAG: prepilin-type N-terminal cleavage/methylation domain-containing protein [Candidatus Hydrogenedentota bacterium]
MLSRLSEHGLRDRRGFTIMELLIAMVIVAIISAIVYSTFTSVLASTETTNIAAEQLYTQSFLTRHIQTNFTQAHPGWQPGAAYRPTSDPQNTVTQVMAESMFLFEGRDDGQEDSITFTASSPILGMSGLPGFLKQVTYEIIDGSEIEVPTGSPYAGFSTSGPVLRITEIPPMSYGDSLGAEAMSIDVERLQQDAEELGIATPTWTFPVGGMNILYFDGEEWVEDWDMALEERLPWALDFTFAWRPWGEEARASTSESADNEFRMVVTIPAGVGIRNAAPAYGRPAVVNATRNAGPTNMREDER